MSASKLALGAAEGMATLEVKDRLPTTAAHFFDGEEITPEPETDGGDPLAWSEARSSVGVLST